MLRSVQCVDWGLLPPAIVPIHPNVTVLLGVNGSGKSSFLDAVKALAGGVNRFGENRTCSHYLNSGRGVHPPARDAFLIGCATLTDRPLTFADNDGDFTLISWITRSRRLFLALPGHRTFGQSDDPAAVRRDLDALIEDHPRSTWMSADAYQNKVLNPIGATPAAQELLSIPQGRTQRILEGRQDQMLRRILGAMGAEHALNALAERREDVARSRESRDRAKKALLEEQLRLSQARERRATSGIPDAEARTVALAVRLAAARKAALAQAEELDGQAEQLQLDHQEATRELRNAPSHHDAQRAHDAVAHLRTRGITATPVAEHALPDWLLAFGPDLLGAVVCERPEEAIVHLGGHSVVVLPSMPVPADDEPAFQHGFWRDPQTGGWHPDRGIRTPVPSNDQRRKLADSVAEMAADISIARKDAQRLRTLGADADRTLARMAPDLPDPLPEDESEIAAEQIAGLIAQAAEQHRALTDLRARQAADEQIKVKLERQQTRVEDAQKLLDELDQSLDDTQQALLEARGLYRRHVHGLIGKLATEFEGLCAAAGMAGRIVADEDAFSEAGVKMRLLVSETPDGQLKDYHQEAELSGGWRAKTSVLMLLACLAAAGEGARLPFTCLDEHSAALDEDRAQEVGEVFVQISRRTGLQVICATPTTTMAAKASWSDQQVGFLKAPEKSMYSPLPHVLVRAEQPTPV